MLECNLGPLLQRPKRKKSQVGIELLPVPSASLSADLCEIPNIGHAYGPPSNTHTLQGPSSHPNMEFAPQTRLILDSPGSCLPKAAPAFALQHSCVHQGGF